MEKQSFWDRYARRYSHFVRADQEAYAQMLEWIRPAVRDRTVLELATGTGVIAHGIVHEAASIEATDASAGMIDVARSHSHSRKLHFSVQDMRYLPYADGSFEVVTAANERTGVLIVFERSIPLLEYQKSGTVVDACVSSELLRNLFFTKASLHDGAVIIRNDRIAAAGCVLPLTENHNISSDLGTRHRAGIGISEVSDAVVVIVSEETGTISVAISGMLKRHLAPQTLEKLLLNELAPQREEKTRNPLKLLRRKQKENKDAKK